MGKRGPPPTPTEILKARGSWRAKTREGEPQAKVKRPTCPKWLREDARAVFRELARKLAALRVVTDVDVNALARYATAFARWRECEDVLDREGQTMTLLSREGFELGSVQRPEVGIAAKLAAELGRLEREFGLTPAARTALRVEVGAKQDQDGKDRFKVISKNTG